jgi:tetratricopeptide (TPR) repeat protein
VNRERIAFVLVLAVLGLMGWSLFSREAKGFSARSVRGKDLPPSLSVLADPVVALPTEGARRDAFERPSADQPLPLLRLPMPALAEFPALLPPPWPDPGPETWSDHLFARPAAMPGRLDDVFEGELAAPGGENTPQDLERSYDWVRKDAFTVFHGRILNPNRYALTRQDVIQFQDVDARSGRDRGGQLTFAPGAYEDFGFADTLLNRIELEAIAWRGQLNPVRAPEARAFIAGLLETGLREPVAFRRAEELAIALVQASPKDVANWMTLGAVWERVFELDRAFALYARLAGEALPEGAGALPEGLPDPKLDFVADSAPRRGLASVLRRVGLDRQAEVQLHRALALHARDPLAAIELGRLELETGRAESAVARLAAARRNLGSTAGLEESLRAGLALGDAQLAARTWSDAAATYGDVAESAPPAHPLAVDAHAGRVAALYLAGDFASAAQEATAAVAALGGQSRLLYLRGIAAAAAGETAAGEVVRDLRGAVTAAPLDAALPLCALAFWLDQAGSREEAGDLLRQALELQPALPYARWLEAHWALRDGDPALAASGFGSLVREHPQCSAALAALGWLMAGEGNANDAEVALRSAEERAPAHATRGGAGSLVWADLAARRGFNLLALGRTTEARAAFERALDLDPNLHAARNGIGAALYAEGDLDGAVAEFSLLQDSLRELPEDAQAVYASTWQARIQDHDQLRIWRDSFDGRRFRPGWNTQSQARLGVEPKLADGALVLRGSHREKGETRAYREVPALAFRAATVDVAVGADHRGDAGVVLALQNRDRESWAFKVYRDRDGQIHWITDRSGKEEYRKLGIAIPAGESFRVEFRLDREPTTPVLQVRVNGAVVFAEGVSNWRSPTGQAAIGAFAETANALAVDVALEQVELVYAAGS